MFPLTALSLALLIPALPDQELSLFSPEDLLHQPFVVLLELQNLEEVSPSELKALRSRIEEDRDRKIAEALADGHRATDIAVRFGLTLGRVSQLRREFEKSWLAFHGEEAESERMALLTAA